MTLLQESGGIQEPIGGNIAYPQNNDLMIMPGVAFDYKKHRIGYGRGFYDRYLERNVIHKKIALAFDFQILQRIPFDENDISPDIIITEKNIVY